MEEDLDEETEGSVDSFCVDEVLEMVLEDTPGARLCYLCRTTDDVEEVFDRSDLMDGGEQQRFGLGRPPLPRR